MNPKQSNNCHHAIVEGILSTPMNNLRKEIEIVMKHKELMKLLPNCSDMKINMPVTIKVMFLSDCKIKTLEKEYDCNT